MFSAPISDKIDTELVSNNFLRMVTYFQVCSTLNDIERAESQNEGVLSARERGVDGSGDGTAR